MSRAERAAAIMDFLADRGYRPDIDGDGDVRFSVRDMTMFVGLDEKDEAYYRICLPNFWPLESAEERERAAIATHDVTSRVKAVKLIATADDTWCLIQTFCPSVGDLLPVMEQCIRTILSAADEYAKAMRA